MTCTTLSTAGARIGELLRLHMQLEDPDAKLDGQRACLTERLAAVYPLGYHVHRRRS